MKKNIILLCLLLLSPFASATDALMLNAINKSFVVFEEKNNQCIESAKSNPADLDTINRVKALDIDFSISIGYLYKRSLYRCSLTELSELIKLIMLVEASDSTEYKLTKIRVEETRALIFNKVDLRLEVKYLALSDMERNELSSIASTLAPFDLVDMYERVQ